MSDQLHVQVLPAVQDVHKRYGPCRQLRVSESSSEVHEFKLDHVILIQSVYLHLTRLNLIGLNQVCQLCVWRWFQTQTCKLEQFMPMQMPCKCYDEGKELHSFEPCMRGEPLLFTPNVYILG